MLLALVCTVCAKVATSTGGGDVGLVRALVILGQANTDMMESCWAGAQLLLPIRSVHRSVYLSLYPLKISLPLKLTTHLSTSNVTVHPTSVSTLIPKRDAMDSSGMM